MHGECWYFFLPFANTGIIDRVCFGVDLGVFMDFGDYWKCRLAVIAQVLSFVL